MFLKKLWNELKNKPFCNDLHFLLFAVILLLLSLHHGFFFIVLALFLVFIYRKTKLFVPTTVVLVLLTLVSYFAGQERELSEGKIQGKFEVVEVEEEYYILKGTVKILVYKNDDALIPGDIIQATLQIYTFDEASYKGDFDSKAYYASKGIYNRGSLKSFEKLEHHVKPATLKYWILSFYQEKLDDHTFQYFKALLFGVNKMDEEVKEAYSSLYLSHILAISGMHLLFLNQVIIWLSRKFFKIEGSVFSLCLLGGYLILLNFPISALRAYLFLVLGKFNERGRIRYTKLDILSISFIIMCFLQPLSVYQNSFILSYMVSFLLVFVQEFYRSSSYLKRHFITSVLSILITLPFTMNQTHQISFIMILFAFILGLLLTKCLLPLILIILVCPVLPVGSVFEFLDHYLIYVSSLFPTFAVLYLNIYWIAGYYICLFLVLYGLALSKRRIRYFIPLTSMVLFTLCLRFIDSTTRVTFIDVGQGDSILIELGFNQGTILIDSFGDNVAFLKSRGTTTIHYMVLTHSDIDHIGTAQDVVEAFDVKHVLYSAYDDPAKYAHLMVQEKLQAVRSGNYFLLGDYRFNILGPIQSYTESNSISVVVQFQIQGCSFLMTGDMTIEEEEDLVRRYGKALESTFLKVGHHGSKTSSSAMFLNSVSPKYAIISVGKRNLYGHPNHEVVTRLNRMSKIYYTKDSGNIEVQILNDSYKVMPYRPR